MLPDCVKNESLRILSEYSDSQVILIKETIVFGGDINSCCQLTTTSGDFFLKWNRSDKYPGMFEYEAEALKLLKTTNTLYIPETIGFSDINEYTFLLLEFIHSTHRKSDFWQNFGIKLSELHKNTSKSFGLDYNNYIGTLHQSNIQHQNWNHFFIEERIEPLVKLARNSNKINCTHTVLFDKFYNLIDEIFPHEPPSLLHGDLWSGNFLVSDNGYSVLIDPAIYYGHREMDIAMSKLFGGFDSTFYDAYNESFPMEKGWLKRLDYYNLYPLLVHANLFGGGYINTIESLLKKI